MNTNLILDGNNILFRAYYTVKNKKYINDVDVSSVEKFFTMIKSYAVKTNADNIYVTWDKRLNKDGINFRRELVDYKGTRNVDKTDLTNIYNAIDLIEELGSAMGFKFIYPYNLEADDVIYFLCNELHGQNIIISADKDLLQLVSDRVKILNTTTGTYITPENFETIVGVSIKDFVDYKCILGDSGDNISGIEKYGKVKSKKLAESKEWSLLTDDQLQIINRNRILMDLSYGPKNSEDEWKSYKSQLEKEESNTFSETKVKELCELWELDGLKRTIIDWSRIIKEKNLLEEWFLNS